MATVVAVARAYECLGQDMRRVPGNVFHPLMPDRGPGHQSTPGVGVLFP